MHSPQRLQYPAPKHDNDTDYNIFKFKNVVETLPVSMVLCCNFETFLIPMEDNVPASKSKQKKCKKQVDFPACVSHKILYSPEIFFTYSGLDVMAVFFNKLKEKEEFVSYVLSKIVKMKSIDWRRAENPHRCKEL